MTQFIVGLVTGVGLSLWIAFIATMYYHAGKKAGEKLVRDQWEAALRS